MSKGRRAAGNFIGISKANGNNGGIFDSREAYALRVKDLWDLDSIKTGLQLYLNASDIRSYPNSGTTWFDLSGNGLNATGGSALTDGVLNSNQTYTTASTGILNTDTHSIFFSVQINNTSGNWDKIFTYQPSGTDRSPGVWRFPSERYIHWRYDPGNSGTDFGDPNGGAGYFNTNTWYYVGVTKNGASTATYVNGVRTTNQSVSNPKTGGNAAIILYEYFSSGQSKMRHVQVYNRVLSDAEVLTNYNAIKGQLV